MSQIKKRQHKILNKRRKQLELNFLANAGGRDYIDERLWRAPNESEFSWSGISIISGRSEQLGTGRKDRTALINDAQRIVQKIQQYLFKEPATRTGIDEDWEKDVDGNGTSADSFWAQVSESFTQGQWVWIQASRLPNLLDDSGIPRNRTLAEKRRDRDTPRLRCFPSISVPDWSFKTDGKLAWIITEEIEYISPSPWVDAKDRIVRTVWEQVEPNKVRVLKYDVTDAASNEPFSITELPLPVIPFVLIGKPSDSPWWFDEVENNQAQLLNLDSLHFESLVKTVFPQLVIPSSARDDLDDKIEEATGATGERRLRVFRELTRSIDGAMVEDGEDKGTTRYLMPESSAMTIIPSERDKKRKALFDMVGLSLFNKETAQSQTVESKQFDMLDTESTLKHRALIMQDAESKVVELAKLIDPDFVEYEPVWATSFDVVDVEGDMSALALIQNLSDITPAMRKIILLSALRIVRNIGGVSDEMIAKAQEEIEKMDFNTVAGFSFAEFLKTAIPKTEKDKKKTTPNNDFRSTVAGA